MGEFTLTANQYFIPNLTEIHGTIDYTATMNTSFRKSDLKNNWYCLRHGESTANVDGLIASNPTTATKGFGLTPSGRQQVYDTMKRQPLLDAGTLVISSDFLRARQTAEITLECLQCQSSLITDHRLRERGFGDWEGTSSDNYSIVWQQDSLDAEHNEANVESCAQVAHRMSELVTSYDARFNARTLLLVSHGDPLQLLACCFSHRTLTEHRQLKPLLTAELRSFTRGWADCHN